MQERSIIERIVIAEEKVEAADAGPSHPTPLELQLMQLRDEMRGEFSAVRGEIRTGDEETRRVLREEIRAGDEETRRYMRVLHEDVIGRLILIQDSRHPRKKR